jgi:hypothetical protein
MCAAATLVTVITEVIDVPCDGHRDCIDARAPRDSMNDDMRWDITRNAADGLFDERAI